MNGQHTITGVVRYQDGPPADTVQVLAVDADSNTDEPLGLVSTRMDGRFTIEFTSDDTGGPTEGSPEVYLHTFRGGDHIETTQTDVSSPDLEIILSESSPGPGPAKMMETMSNMHHGVGSHRGIDTVPRGPAYSGRGRFGRMFPYLHAADHDKEFLAKLGLPGEFLDEGTDSADRDASIPAGYVFLGQFIDHDITLDPLSSLSRQNDPEALRNFRTPRLDLDSVYGAGPEADPFRYESESAGGDNHLFLLAQDGRYDVPRNYEKVALTGDHRNDENLILSQFQFAMLRFHNSIVHWLDEEREDVFETAQRLARWHYQWIVLHEYLEVVCDEDVVADVRDGDGRQHFTVGPEDNAYMPLEFAGAAYRFGHSQVRNEYQVNAEFKGPLFGPPSNDRALGAGFEPVPERKAVNWEYLFEFESSGVSPQNARKIDSKLPSHLLELPFMSGDPEEQSLASRNLLRGESFDLPSGSTVAAAMNERVLTNHELGFDRALNRYGQPEGTEPPLWYYVLAEAAHEELGDGEHLGPVGSRIVSEVLIGLVDSDATSFRTVDPGWTPLLPGANSPEDDFVVADLLDFADRE